MKKKQIWSMLLALAIALSSVTGCGSSNASSANGGQEPSSPHTAPEDGGAQGSGSVTVTSVIGDENVDIVYETAPERVVSLAGFATEMLLALGLEDKIVGYAWQDNAVLPAYQEAFESLTPLCAPGMDPGEETVLAAEPDFVVAWATQSEDDYFSYQSLQKNGITMYGFHSERTEGATLEDVYDDFLNLGRIFRVEDRAEALVNEMKARVQAVEDRVKDLEPVSVFVCDIGSSEEQAFTAGGGLPADLIAKAGGQNIIQDVQTNWTRVSWEYIAEADPDWIIIDYYTDADDIEGTIDFLKNQPALKDLDAVINDRFITVGLTEISASERNDDTIELFASYFHPENP